MGKDKLDVNARTVLEALELCDRLIRRSRELSPLDLQKVQSLRETIHSAWRVNEAQYGAIERIEDRVNTEASVRKIQALTAFRVIESMRRKQGKK